MKPRQRKPQKQTSRLYARGNDHRDILYYDETTQKYIYHNALYYTEEDEEQPKAENLVWLKYPQNAILHYSSDALCNFDVDRQFNYGERLGGGGHRNLIFGLECGITVFIDVYGENSNIYVTEDGMRWQKINVGSDYGYFAQQNINPFGNDGLVSFYKGTGDQTTFIARVVTFSKNEETNLWEYEAHTYSYITDTAFTHIYYICNTDQGCILTYFHYGYDASGTYYAENVTYSHIDHAGSLSVKSTIFATAAPLFSYSSYWSYCKKGNLCATIVWTGYAPSRYSGDRYYRLFLATTTDKGATWNVEMIEEWFTPSGDTGYHMHLDMYCRCGKLYAIWASEIFLNGKAHILEVSSGGYTEIALPKWVDLPVLQGGGACVNGSPTVGETIRIAIDPSETTGADLLLQDLIRSNQGGTSENISILNNGNGNILYQDGEKIEGSDSEDFFLVLGGSSGWRAFFDNPQLASSTRAFAWQGVSYSGAPGIPDTVQPNDYCVRGEQNGLYTNL